MLSILKPLKVTGTIPLTQHLKQAIFQPDVVQLQVAEFRYPQAGIKQVQRLMWRYINRCRAEPAMANSSFLFLTRDGRPMTKDRVEKIMNYFKMQQIAAPLILRFA